ncbi:hypothetical protein [Halochromatium glycolicum]|uniref:hypothetical protein n=1 Tax=Halochromatium glycolicum TaxID=85075 RepID=UPI00190C9400|nr:hypothetical protein [Halochromatium glycolicum]
MPEDRGLLRLLVEKVLEKPRRVQGGGIGIPLTVIAELGEPISWLLTVDHLEKGGWIQIGLAGIIEYPKIVGLNANHEVRLIRGQIWILGLRCG